MLNFCLASIVWHLASGIFRLASFIPATTLKNVGGITTALRLASFVWHLASFIPAAMLQSVGGITTALRLAFFVWHLLSGIWHLSFPLQRSKALAGFDRRSLGEGGITTALRLAFGIRRSSTSPVCICIPGTETTPCRHAPVILIPGLS